MRWLMLLLVRRFPPLAAVYAALFAWRLFRRVRGQKPSAQIGNASGGTPPPGDRPGPGMAPESSPAVPVVPAAGSQTLLASVRAQAAPAAIEAARMGARGVRTTARLGWKAAGLARRLPGMPGGGAGIDAAPAARSAEFPSIRFEWMVRQTDPAVVRAALDAAGIQAGQQSPPAGSEVDPGLLDTLMAAGLHLDQESPGSVQPAQAMFTGVAGPQALTDAVGRVVSQGHFGLVVDTAMGTVEIDEHQDIGRGPFILVEPGGAAQSMPSGTTRALLGALRAIEAGASGTEHTADWPRPHHHEGTANQP